MNPEVSSTMEHLAIGFLRTSGWLASVEQHAAVDTNGPVPWFTYGATQYLSKIVRPDYRVLEFGAGNSTRWWSSRVSEVVSVEHDPGWAASLREADLPNITVIERSASEPVAAENMTLVMKEFCPLALCAKESTDPTKNYRAGLLDYLFLSYASVLLDFPKGHFDMIVIDGMARVLTTWAAVRQLSENGIIVFDNSDRDEYADAYIYLEQSGFTRIDFPGLGPINPYEWCTSLFVRSLNSLHKVVY
jgi:hypothetical protein